MNEKHIDDILSNLYDMVQDARALPLGADKCILERDKVLDMLDEVIGQLPAELKEARTLVQQRAEIVAQARREAENIVNKAKEEAERLVAQEPIFEEAKRRCADMVAQTKTQLNNLRKVSNDYMDDALRRTEEAIAQSLAEVQETRAKFRALTESKDPASDVTEG